MNRLQNEKSPYLLQHTDNPVEWYPWTGPAFQRARAENRLIFLSIGYSTCHWCHVMAHECFEDGDVAALLNENYIAIKVDREERPDIDQVYMEVCQRLTGSGGWPLTIIMTPDARPFYAATYIPKYGRQGRPGLMELLPWVSAKWHESPELLYKAAREIIAEMKQRHDNTTTGTVGLDLHLAAERALQKSHDNRYGGFGQAPKFPRPHDLTFLLYRSRLAGHDDCLEMVEQTLSQMRYGGIFDQLGFGFHRYATDRKWLVPHFEKMLYDQAGLVRAYLYAWCTTGKPLYERTVRELLSYLQRDMCSPAGAFFSAEDADSEGGEGVFYLWTMESICALLGDRAEAFCQAYNVTDLGNYRDEATGKLTGSNILHLSSGEHDPESQDKLFAQERELLLRERAKRIRPHLDDKIITAWNGMAISAFAEAGRILGEESFVASAAKAAGFILGEMRDDRGRLLRRYRDGDAAIFAFSEDYAFLARGLLDLYNADFNVQWLEQVTSLARSLAELFQDPQTGRLYDTPVDGENLLVRPAGTFDGAMPSASSVALEVYARLYLLTGDDAWRAVADLLLSALSSDIIRYPAGYTQALESTNWLLRPTREIVIVGHQGDATTEQMLATLQRSELVQTVVLFKPERDPGEITRLAAYTRDMATVDGQAAAYVCQDFLCIAPVITVDELTMIIDSVP